MEVLLVPLVSMVAVAASYFTARRGARRSPLALAVLLWLPLAYIAGVACAVAVLSVTAPALGIQASNSEESAFMRAILWATALPIAGAVAGAINGRKRHEARRLSRSAPSDNHH